MMRVNSQRGISLMLLILAITVFAAVAIGIVTLLSLRYQSYPYQVQSYQAYALANAGVEFAIRYAKDNNTDPSAPTSFSLQPQLYIPTDGTYKTFSSGNLTFSLKYVPGCPDRLYSKATYGTATREVILSNFGSYLGAQGSSVYIVSSQITRSCYGAGCAGRTCYNGTTTYSCPADPYPGPYSGDRIQITYCNPYAANANNYTMMLEGDSTDVMGTVAAMKPVSLGRIGFTDNASSLPVVNGVPTPQTGNSLKAWWAWDFTCGITGPASQGLGSGGYCPEKYTQGGDHCPSTSGPYAGMNLVDCQTVGQAPWNGGPAVNQFYYPTINGWDGTSNPPNSGYPFFWNTDQTSSADTAYDATCRPQAPCDPWSDPNCAWNNAGQNPGALNICTQLWDTQCAMAGQWGNCWPPYPWGSVACGNQYACFDATLSCYNAGSGYTPISRSRSTCRYPLGCGNPVQCPNPISSYNLSVNANRLTIETIGHLDAVVPVKMYLSFYTYVSVGINRSVSGAVQPPVKNVFVFTVH